MKRFWCWLIVSPQVWLGWILVFIGLCGAGVSTMVLAIKVYAISPDFLTGVAVCFGGVFLFFGMLFAYILLLGLVKGVVEDLTGN